MLAVIGTMLSALATWLGSLLGSFLVLYLIARFSDKILGWLGELVGIVSNSAGVAVDLPNLSGLYASLPPQVLDVLSRLHFDTGMAWIVAAIGLRAAGGMFEMLRAGRRGVTP